MLIALSLVLVFGCVGCFAWGLVPILQRRQVERSMRERVYTQAGVDKRALVLNQLAVVFAPLNRLFVTQGYVSYATKRLQAGGVRFSPMQLLTLQEIGAVTGVIVYFLVLGSGTFNVGWLVVSGVIGFFVPHLWLGNKIQQRRMSISRDLPEVVDLLGLCVDAGMDFMNALGRVVKEFRACPTTEELGIAIQEVRVGKRRRDALRAFSDRVQTMEASSFTRTLVQADRMGTGIAEALRILSDDMRIQRYNWAERFAQQAPVKMLLPLLLSLGAALIIVAGPVLGQFLNGGFGVSNYTAGAGTSRPNIPRAPQVPRAPVPR